MPLQSGAVDFIEKPFRDQALIDRSEQALEQNKSVRVNAARRDKITRRADTTKAGIAAIAAAASAAARLLRPISKASR